MTFNQFNPEETITVDEAMAVIVKATEHHVGFPQGEPIPVAVTLTDEQWNAVGLALSVFIHSHRAEEGRIAPPWIVNQMIEAVNTIATTNMGVAESMMRGEP